MLNQNINAELQFCIRVGVKCPWLRGIEDPQKEVRSLGKLPSLGTLITVKQQESITAVVFICVIYIKEYILKDW